jgi:hypothetical protein
MVNKYAFITLSIYICISLINCKEKSVPLEKLFIEIRNLNTQHKINEFKNSPIDSAILNFKKFDDSFESVYNDSINYHIVRNYFNKYNGTSLINIWTQS